MGAPASVRIANIYMYVLLSSFLNRYDRMKPKFLRRLIDDIFFPWEYGETELLEFYNTLNNFNETIKFKINYSKIQ